jgi:flagellar M-ring protein FliF
VRHTVSPRGAVRKISTAVLVDQSIRWEGVGAKTRKILVPPSAEVLKGVHDIVAGITGFSEQRGDQIIVETLPFENTLEAEPPGLPAAPVKQTLPRFDLKQLIVIGGGALLVLLIAGLAFVLLRKGAARSAVDMSPAAIAEGESSRPGQPGAVTSAERHMQDQISENNAQQALMEAEALRGIKLPVTTKKTEVLVKHIRDSVHKDPGNATNVLRTWIADADTQRTS